MYVAKEFMTCQQFMEECQKADTKVYMDLAPVRDGIVDLINTALLEWARDNPSIDREQKTPYVRVSVPYASVIEKRVCKNVMKELESKGFGVDNNGITGNVKNLILYPLMDPL